MENPRATPTQLPTRLFPCLKQDVTLDQVNAILSQYVCGASSDGSANPEKCDPITFTRNPKLWPTLRPNKRKGVYCYGIDTISRFPSKTKKYNQNPQNFLCCGLPTMKAKAFATWEGWRRNHFLARLSKAHIAVNWTSPSSDIPTGANFDDMYTARMLF